MWYGKFSSVVSYWESACDFAPLLHFSQDNISYPRFVHAIRENINGLGSYNTRLKVECDMNSKLLIFFVLHKNKQGVTNLSLSRHAFS